MYYEKIDFDDLERNLGTGSVPTSPYTCPEQYDREIENIFKKSWLKVAITNEIPNPGDYKVKRLDFAKTSVIIIRGKDNIVRAFHNVCSHRGNKVVPDEDYEIYGKNRAAVLSCRFHGWVFDAAGKLVSVPLEGQFPPCFEKSENGLAPIHCDVWAGFVFINLDSEKPQPLLEYLGAYADHFAGFPFEALNQGFSYHTILETNWKIGIDAFAEAYHVATLHAGSLGNVSKCGVDGVRFYGPHKTCSVYFDMQPKHPPLAEIANRRATSNLASIYQEKQSEFSGNINPNKLPNFAFELSICFPNLLLHVAKDTWFTHQFWPLSHGRTLWEGRFYCPPSRKHSDVFAAEYAHILGRSAWLEDTGTMENTFSALLSGAKKHQWLMDEEVLIRHQLAVIEKLVA